MPAFDPQPLRAEFPALALELAGRPVVFLDGPGGTQVPQRVIDAVAAYYRETNANMHGAFATSVRSDAILEEAHAAVADLLGAASPAEVKFGQNMTSLTFALSRSIGRMLAPGRRDRDHRGWTTRRTGGPGSPRRRTRGRSSARSRSICRRARSTWHVARRRPVGAHAARGGRVRLERGRDDQSGRRDRAAGARGRGARLRRRRPLRAARPDRRGGARDRLPGLLGLQVLRPARRRPVGPARRSSIRCRPTRSARRATAGRPARRTTRGSPGRWRPWSTSPRSGTGSGRGCRPAAARARAGATQVGPGVGASRRARLLAGMRAIEAYERTLSARLLAGLAAIPGLTVYGLADPARVAERTPTFAVTLAGWTPRGVAEALAAPRHLRLGRRLLRHDAHRGPRPGRDRRRRPARARPLHHGRRGGPAPGRAGGAASPRRSAERGRRAAEGRADPERDPASPRADVAIRGSRGSDPPGDLEDARARATATGVRSASRGALPISSASHRGTGPAGSCPPAASSGHSRRARSARNAISASCAATKSRSTTLPVARHDRRRRPGPAQVQQVAERRRPVERVRVPEPRRRALLDRSPAKRTPLSGTRTTMSWSVWPRRGGRARRPRPPRSTARSGRRRSGRADRRSSRPARPRCRGPGRHGVLALASPSRRSRSAQRSWPRSRTAGRRRCRRRGRSGAWVFTTTHGAAVRLTDVRQEDLTLSRRGAGVDEQNLARRRRSPRSSGRGRRSGGRRRRRRPRARAVASGPSAARRARCRCPSAAWMELMPSSATRALATSSTTNVNWAWSPQRPMNRWP